MDGWNTIFDDLLGVSLDFHVSFAVSGRVLFFFLIFRIIPCSDPEVSQSSVWHGLHYLEPCRAHPSGGFWLWMPHVTPGKGTIINYQTFKKKTYISSNIKKTNKNTILTTSKIKITITTTTFLANCPAKSKWCCDKSSRLFSQNDARQSSETAKLKNWMMDDGWMMMSFVIGNLWDITKEFYGIENWLHIFAGFFILLDFYIAKLLFPCWMILLRFVTGMRTFQYFLGLLDERNLWLERQPPMTDDLCVVCWKTGRICHGGCEARHTCFGTLWKHLVVCSHFCAADFFFRGPTPIIVENLGGPTKM